MSAARNQPPLSSPPPTNRWLGVLVAGALIVATLVVVNWPRDKAGKPKNEITAGQPLEEVVVRFRERIEAGDPTAKDLLGPAPVFNDVPVSEAEADARQAEFYLRRPELKILAIYPGEPDAQGKRKATPNRYTLVTKVSGSTPPLRIRNARGEVESPSQLFIINPDLVIEVRDGKIHALRAELHRD